LGVFLRGRFWDVLKTWGSETGFWGLFSVFSLSWNSSKTPSKKSHEGKKRHTHFRPFLRFLEKTCFFVFFGFWPFLNFEKTRKRPFWQKTCFLAFLENPVTKCVKNPSKTRSVKKRGTKKRHTHFQVFFSFLGHFLDPIFEFADFFRIWPFLAATFKKHPKTGQKRLKSGFSKWYIVYWYRNTKKVTFFRIFSRVFKNRTFL